MCHVKDFCLFGAFNFIVQVIFDQQNWILNAQIQNRSEKYGHQHVAVELLSLREEVPDYRLLLVDCGDDLVQVVDQVDAKAEFSERLPLFQRQEPSNYSTRPVMTGEDYPSNRITPQHSEACVVHGVRELRWVVVHLNERVMTEHNAQQGAK